jgi:hypothetical protein
MKKSLQESIWQLVLILTILFCVWSFNIRQAHFYLTPMENLSSPPKRAVEIVYLNPFFDYAVNRYRTHVFVQTEDGEIYRCCSWHDTTDWVKQNSRPAKYTQHELECADSIRKRWGIFESKDVVHSLLAGWCGDSTVDKVASYQIDRDGTIRGRYVRDNPVTEIYDMVRIFCASPVSMAIVLAWFLFRILIKEKPDKSKQKIKAS